MWLVSPSFISVVCCHYGRSVSSFYNGYLSTKLLYIYPSQAGINEIVAVFDYLTLNPFG